MCRAINPELAVSFFLSGLEQPHIYSLSPWSPVKRIVSRCHGNHGELKWDMCMDVGTNSQGRRTYWPTKRSFQTVFGNSPIWLVTRLSTIFALPPIGILPVGSLSGLDFFVHPWNIIFQFSWSLSIFKVCKCSLYPANLDFEGIVGRKLKGVCSSRNAGASF